MSAMAMILTAAMVVPASGPAMESGEVADPHLHLSGTWVGDFCFQDYIMYAKVIDGRFLESAIPLSFSEAPIADGEGRVKWRLFREPYLGIFEQEGGRVRICLRLEKHGWPRSFQVNDVQRVLILHRVKPRK